MFKKIPLFLSILTLLTASLACGLPVAQPPDNIQPATSTPDTSRLTPDTAPCPDPLCLTTSFSLLDLQNRPLDENVVKLFSVAVDDERNRVYVAGIMTPDVAILDGATEEWIGMVKTGIAERGLKYLYFDSAAQYLYVFEVNTATLHRVNVATGELAAPAKLNGGFGSLAFVDEARTRFYIFTKKGLTAFDGNTLQELYMVKGLGENAGSMVYDEAADSIYLLATQDKTARSIIVIDAASGKVTDEIQYITQADGRARWFSFDSAERNFIIGLERAVIVLDMNGNELRAFPLKNSGVLEDLLYDPATDQTFALSVAQPANGQVAGVGGHMDVYDKRHGWTPEA